MPEKFNILICDVNVCVGGHYISHNQYILDNFLKIEHANPWIRISFLYNIEASKLLVLDDLNRNRINFIDIELSGKNRFRKKSSILFFVEKFVKNNEIDQLIFMDFDKYQIAFLLRNFQCKVSGILFRPHHRIVSSNDALMNRLKVNLKRFKKKVAEKMLVYNHWIKDIFILNDNEGVTLLNTVHRCNHFKYLPDPIYIFPADKSFNYIGDKESFKFLIFGWLDDRKNIFNILKAFNLAQFSFKVELLLIGPAREEYLNKLQLEIDKLNLSDSGQKQIYICAKYVSNEEMEFYFSVTDVVLLIYKDFYGSSGLLGRAALHNKRVIGSNVGVVADLITRNYLGMTCDPHDIVKISEALVSIRNFKVNTKQCHEFYHQYSPEAFLSTLLSV